MTTSVFVNGEFLSVDEARVSAFDAGVQHGVGLFETMVGGVAEEKAPSQRSSRAADGEGREVSGEAWVFRLEEHMERLAGSARELGLSSALRTGALAQAVVETVRRSGLRRARVRLTVTGGDLNLLTRGEHGSAGRGAMDPTVLIVAQPAMAYPAGMFERGVGVVIADTRANPLNPFEGHKTLNYWWRLRELQVAAGKGAAEAIVLQVTNHLCGGCVSNVFVVRGGELATPIARGEEGKAAEQRSSRAAADEGEEEGVGPIGGQQKRREGLAIPSPVLPGVTRGWVMEEAERLGITVRRRMLSVNDLMDADEVLLTNSSWGVLPVVKVEAEAIGDGVVGEVATRLAQEWARQARE